MVPQIYAAQELVCLKFSHDAIKRHVNSSSLHVLGYIYDIIGIYIPFQQQQHRRSRIQMADTYL